MARRSRFLAVFRLITQNPWRDFAQKWVNPRKSNVPFPLSLSSLEAGFWNRISAVFVRVYGQLEETETVSVMLPTPAGHRPPVRSR